MIIMMFMMLMFRPLRQEEERREKEIDPKHNRRIELLRKSRNICYCFVNDDICRSTYVALEEYWTFLSRFIGLMSNTTLQNLSGRR